MLQLLIGPSGSGKTRHLTDILASRIRAGADTLYLLVPEQYSFESERMLLDVFSPAEAARVQVLSFTRLADTVLRQVGGLAEERLDDATRALLMSSALEQTAAVAQDAGETLLGVQPWQVTDTAYVQELLALYDEIKLCAVPLLQIETLGEQLRADTSATGISLQRKTADLYRLFAAYEGLAAQGGADNADILTTLADKLPQTDWPQGATVLVDGFKGFTAPEMRVLERLMPRVQDMVITLSTDTAGRAHRADADDDATREFSLFSPVTDTVDTLMDAAVRHGLVWEICRLTADYRHQDGALAAVAAGLYHPTPIIYEGMADAVTVTPCADVYEECTYVARYIRRLMRQEGYRCRDITVVCRQPDAYRGILEDALVEAEIPYFSDERQDILSESLTVYIRAALRIAVGGFDTEELLRLLKTDLTALSVTEIAELENYLYMWRIDGVALTQPFTENPAGMGQAMTAHTTRQLQRLEHLRRRAVEPLTALRQALRGTVNGREFAYAVYALLTADGTLARRIREQADTLERLAMPMAAARTARIWDEMIHLLDCMAAALPQRLPGGRMEELFTMLAGGVDMGHIPQGLDAVTVAVANRSRYSNPRAVFILGANEEAFPAYPQNTEMLSDDDRAVWEQNGVRLSGDTLRACIEERYYAYMAAAAPRERLVVTYITEGDNLPSSLVSNIRQILPAHHAGLPAEEWPQTEADMLRTYATRLTPTPYTESLRQVVAENPVYAGRLAALNAADTPYRLADAAVAEGLFGRDMRLSASRADTFYECRFAYFCKYGLRIRPRPVAQVDAAAFGTIVHYVMETVLPTYTAPDGLLDTLRQAETVDEDALTARVRQDVHDAVMRYLQTDMGGEDGKPARLLYRLQLAERAAANLLWHTVMELRQSEFHPAEFELHILPEENGEDGVMSVRLPFDGGQVTVSGKVDRVDLCIREDGDAYVRVVDYKTGSKKFSLSQLPYGLHTQMLLYLYIICDNSRRWVAEGHTLRPAGVLYHPVDDMLVARGTENVATERLRKMRMDGLVLDDAAAILSMEAEGEGVFIPASIKRGVPVGNLVTARQFALLRGVVERLFTGMASTLLSGDIAALPLKNSQHDACQYCDYRAVCAHEADGPIRPFDVTSDKAVLASLDEEVAQDADTGMDT